MTNASHAPWENFCTVTNTPYIESDYVSATLTRFPLTTKPLPPLLRDNKNPNDSFNKNVSLLFFFLSFLIIY